MNVGRTCRTHKVRWANITCGYVGNCLVMVSVRRTELSRVIVMAMSSVSLMEIRAVSIWCHPVLRQLIREEVDGINMMQPMAQRG